MRKRWNNKGFGVVECMLLMILLAVTLVVTREQLADAITLLAGMLTERRW